MNVDLHHVPHLVDMATGSLLPWEILRVDINREVRYPIPGYAGLSPAGLDPVKIEVTVKGLIRQDKPLYFRTLRLEPHGMLCTIAGMYPKADGSTVVDLREYIRRKPFVPLRKTKNRIRYKRVGVDRFAVRDNRGPVLGYVVRTARGYEIEGHGRTSNTMRGVLGHFRDVDRLEVAQRFIDQMKRDGAVKGILEHASTRTKP